MSTMFKVQKLENKAIVTIWGYVGGSNLQSERVSEAFDDITEDGYKLVDFHIHTYGGDVFDGNLICNVLDGFDGDVDIYIDGIAASMGSVIMLRGRNIYIAENGYIMIHPPQGGCYGNAVDLEKYAGMLRKLEKQFKADLMKRTGMSDAEVDELMKGDNWFDAEDAIKAKLVTGTFNPKTKNDPVKVTKAEMSAMDNKSIYAKFVAQFDKSVFNPKPKNKMNKEAVIARYGLTTVTAESSDEDIYKAIDAKLAEVKTAKETAEQALANKDKEAIAIEVDAAITAGKITKEQRDKYIARGEKLGLEELKAVFADMNAYDPVTNHTKGGGTHGGKKMNEDRSDWKFSDWLEKDNAGLEAMTDKERDALYKAEFDQEPGQ